MAVNVNGESSQGVTPGIISGTLEFPGTTSWFAESDNFIYSSGGSINYDGVDVAFVLANENKFKGTPIVVATLEGGTGSQGMPLTLRLSAISPSGFTVRVYNPTSSAVTVGSILKVNWIAIENSGLSV